MRCLKSLVGFLAFMHFLIRSILYIAYLVGPALWQSDWISHYVTSSVISWLIRRFLQFPRIHKMNGTKSCGIIFNIWWYNVPFKHTDPCSPKAYCLTQIIPLLVFSSNRPSLCTFLHEEKNVLEHLMSNWSQLCYRIMFSK